MQDKKHEEDVSAAADAEQGPENHSQTVTQWPAKCVYEALSTHRVPTYVSEALISQLSGTAGERSLRNSEVSALADKLLTVRSPASEEEAK